MTETSPEGDPQADPPKSNGEDSNASALMNGAPKEIVQKLEPYVQPGMANEAALVVQSMLVQQSHSGPLPSAREFRGYETTVPGSGDRIIAMAEREQTHRHELERHAVNEDIRLKARGQLSSLLALAMLLVVVFAFAYLGHPVEGATIGTAVIVAVVAIFNGQKWFPKADISQNGGAGGDD